jgi:hypothetical protein
MIGGVKCNKTNQTIINVPIGLSGSIRLGGTSVADRWYWPLMIGGVTASGTPYQTSVDYIDGIAGIRIGGRSGAEYQKFYESYRTGICRAMVNPNICTTPPPRTDVLMTSDVIPILESALPTLVSAGWCEVVERCSLGVLPKIVQNRQGVYLPPKEPVRRRVTSLTQKSTVRVS